MAYLKPPWFTRKIFNPLAMASGMSNTETMTLTKRGTKEPQKIPVITVDVNDIKYLVSTRGEAQWVKNLRANPHVTITTKGRAAKYFAQEVPEQDRPPILAAYRQKAGKVVEGYFQKLPHEKDHPVFALTQAP
jgi:deazaflavin-dependent oxidoreductase (nitroreductase family)